MTHHHSMAGVFLVTYILVSITGFLVLGQLPAFSLWIYHKGIDMQTNWPKAANKIMDLEDDRLIPARLL